MPVQQLYTSCLSEAAYFIHSKGEAAVVDPLRDIDQYLKLADEHGVKIKFIFETHFHADFVSGHLELAKATGAAIIYGPGTRAGFKIHEAKDGEEFAIGDLQIRALHTPGHTLESTCYLLINEEGKEECIFTGDTLFVGDVGRPDLFSGNMTKEELAEMMYDSLQKHIMPLADDVIVYPAHGPGSACGKALGKETFSTMGTQKATNHALQPQTKEAFVTEVTTGLNKPPAHFPINAKMNQQGYDTMDEVMDRASKALSIADFKAAVKGGAWIIDTRDSTLFTEGFVPDSVSIGLDGRYAEWAGQLIPFTQNLVLVTGTGKEQESITRLARVGIDKVQGYLGGGFENWQSSGEKTDMIINIEADELAMDIPHDNRLEVIDVRKEGEYEGGHVKGATNVSLSSMSDPFNIAAINDEHNLYVHCAGGYRSVIACSLLKREGYHNVRNIIGGWAKMKDQKGIPVVLPGKVSVH